MIYIPNDCANKECHVHFAFHGCGMSPEDMQDPEFFGLNMVAATNDIIVVYPGSKDCFNDGGFFDSDYWLTNEGLYPETFKSMICRVTSEENSADCPDAGPF